MMRMYVRANGGDGERVSQALAQKAKAGGIQPGQRGNVGWRKSKAYLLRKVEGLERKVGELKQHNNYRLLRWGLH